MINIKFAAIGITRQDRNQEGLNTPFLRLTVYMYFINIFKAFKGINSLEFNPLLGLYPFFVRVLYLLHFSDQIGHLNDLRVGVAAGKDYA